MLEYLKYHFGRWVFYYGEIFSIVSKSMDETLDLTLQMLLKNV